VHSAAVCHVKIPIPDQRQPIMTVHWNLSTRLAFRLALAFFVLVFFPQPLPVSFDWVRVVAPKAVPWIALHVLYPDIANGVSRNFYGVARLLFVLAIAMAATVVWSIADRKRTNYETLHAWLRLYVRVVGGALMLGYGSAKVFFPGQMRPPTLSTLLVPFGDLSPLARLWLFMGSSHLYTFFSGAVEVVGGALLFIPRLTTVGALITAAAMTNVALLDVSHDVGTGATENAILMLLVSIFLLAPELRAFLDAFILRRELPARPERLLFARTWLHHSVVLLTLLTGCYLIGSDLMEEQRFSKTAAAKPLQMPYYGVWTVDEFSVNGTERPPLFTDPVRWKLIVFDWGAWYDKPSLVIHFGPGTRRLFDMNFDGIRKSLVLLRTEPLSKGSTSGTLVVNDSDPSRLILEGDFEGQRIRAVLHRTASGPALRKWPLRPFSDHVYWGDDIII
jgi:hypothetical protein